MPPNQTIQLYDQIRDLLIANGQSFWQAIEALHRLDNAITNDLTREYLNHQNPDQVLDIYQFLITKPDDKTFSQKLGIEPNHFHQAHYRQLQDCYQRLQQLLAEPSPAAQPNDQTPPPPASE